MKGPMILGVATLALAACGPTYDRQPEPVYQPAPRASESPPRYEAAPAHSDRSLHDAVHDALSRAPSLRGTAIHLTVQDGRVRLSGTVDSAHQRQTAHDIAHSVDGVRDVETGDLRVRY